MAGRRLPLFATAPGAARVCQIVMKANVRANQSAMLDAEEASMRARLLEILPGECQRGGTRHGRLGVVTSGWRRCRPQAVLPGQVRTSENW
jgi:hypothetical protein